MGQRLPYPWRFMNFSNSVHPHLTLRPDQQCCPPDTIPSSFCSMSLQRLGPSGRLHAPPSHTGLASREAVASYGNAASSVSVGSQLSAGTAATAATAGTTPSSEWGQAVKRAGAHVCAQACSFRRGSRCVPASCACRAQRPGRERAALGDCLPGPPAAGRVRGGQLWPSVPGQVARDRGGELTTSRARVQGWRVHPAASGRLEQQLRLHGPARLGPLRYDPPSPSMARCTCLLSAPRPVLPCLPSTFVFRPGCQGAAHWGRPQPPLRLHPRPSPVQAGGGGLAAGLPQVIPGRVQGLRGLAADWGPG